MLELKEIDIVECEGCSKCVQICSKGVFEMIAIDGKIKSKIVHPETNQPVTGREIVGELLLKGPHIFSGYWNNPEATIREITRPFGKSNKFLHFIPLLLFIQSNAVRLESYPAR